MENIVNDQQQDNMLTINNEIIGYLIETSKWGKFLAIVGFIGMGLLFLLGIVFIIGFSIFSSASTMGVPMRIMGFIYMIMAASYYFPLKYLYNYSVLLKQGVAFSNQEAVNSGFKNLKSIFKFFGVFTIVVLSLYALIIIIAVPAAIIFASR